MFRAPGAAGLLTIFCILCLTACKSNEPLERVSVGKGNQDTDLRKNQTGEQETGKDPKNKKPASEEAEEEGESSEQDGRTTAEIVFPQLSFKGRGYTTYKLKDRLSMSIGIETKLDDDSLILDTRSAKVECGSKSGCDQREVDQSVNATLVGHNIYRRVGKTELKELKADGFNAASYGIFAKSVRAKNGYTFTFDRPLPVYPWPAAKSRYEPLERGSESWTTTVTADKYVPVRAGLSPNSVQSEISERAGVAKKTFSATITVSMQNLSKDLVKLTFEVNLPDDRDRMLYKYFPVPRSSGFVIDTNKKDVRAVSMTNWSNGDKSKTMEESVLEYKLCSKTTSGETKTFNCD